ncbi:MAG: hypothetical protein HDR88_12745 [Bacteroides sp.]|nr:hypothetical protein [Bacteroides sp.]
MFLDSLISYAKDYHHSIEDAFDEHGAQLAISQQANYNYKVHQRERLKAEERNRILKNWLIGISFVLLIFSVIILWLKNRNKQTVIELRTALNNIERLEQSLKDQSLPSENSLSKLVPVDVNLSAPELRDQLKNKLLTLYHSGESKEIPQEILQSEPYSRLQQFIKKKEELNEEDPLWKDLENVVTLCSPNFKEHLELLVGGTLSSFDLHTALLIKCGVTPTQMAILFMRTKGTIVSRRESICLRIFGEKLGTKATDAIIRLL